MFCPKCGKKNDDNSLFCTWCGAGFGSVSTQSLSAAISQPRISRYVSPLPELWRRQPEFSPVCIFQRYSDTTFRHAFNALPVMSGGVLFFGMIMHKNPGFVLFHFNNLAFCKLTFFRQYSILNLDISIIKVCVRFDYREYYDPFGRIT